MRRNHFQKKLHISYFSTNRDQILTIIDPSFFDLGALKHYNISIIYTLKDSYNLRKGTQRLYILNWALERAPLPNEGTPHLILFFC